MIENNKVKNDPRIIAIREDPIIGKGSCSCIDECYDDEELLELLDSENILTKTEALRKMKKIHKVWLDRCKDIQGL